MRYEIFRNEDFNPTKGNTEYGKILDTKTGKDVLYAIYDKNVFASDGYHFGVRKVKDYCVALFDDKYLMMLRNNAVFAGVLMHELGHFINKDTDAVSPLEKKVRVWYVEHNLVDPKEIKADRFAADQIGVSTMVSALKYLKQQRLKDGRPGTNLAVTEFDLRIKALQNT